MEREVQHLVVLQVHFDLQFSVARRTALLYSLKYKCGQLNTRKILSDDLL